MEMKIQRSNSSVHNKKIIFSFQRIKKKCVVSHSREIKGRKAKNNNMFLQAVEYLRMS